MNRSASSESMRYGVALMIIALAFAAVCAADNINEAKEKLKTKDSKNSFKNTTAAGHFYPNQNSGHVNYGNQPSGGYDIGHSNHGVSGGYGGPQYAPQSHGSYGYGYQPSYGYNHHLVDDYVCDVDASILIVANSEQFSKQNKKDNKKSDLENKDSKQERNDGNSNGDSNSEYGSNPYGSPAGGSNPYGSASGGSNPYGSPAGGSNPYGSAAGGSNPYGNPAGGSNPYGSATGGSNPYGNSFGGSNHYSSSSVNSYPYNSASSGSNLYGSFAGGVHPHVGGVASSHVNNYGPLGSGNVKHAIAHRLRCSVIAIHNDTACTTCCQLSARHDKSIAKERIVGFIVEGNQIHLSNAYRKKRDVSSPSQSNNGKESKFGNQKNGKKEGNYARPDMPIFPPKNSRCVCCAPKHHYDNHYIGDFGKPSHESHGNQHFGGHGQHPGSFSQQSASYVQPQSGFVPPPPAMPYGSDDYGHAYMQPPTVYGGPNNAYGHAQPLPPPPPSAYHGNTGYAQSSPSKSYGKEKPN